MASGLRAEDYGVVHRSAFIIEKRMSPTFNSGAFVQQCFASHRLCLSVKKLALPEKVLLSCTSCNMLHRLTIRALASSAPALLALVGQIQGEKEAGEHLMQCFTTHQTALGVREVDVVRDAVGLRCAECRRTYDLAIAVFETHQR